MDIFTLENPHLRMRVTPHSAALLSLESTAGYQPVLRPWQETPIFDPGDSALFPMLPLANRVAGNRYPQRQSIVTLPGAPGDPNGFLHGNGWQHRWDVAGVRPHEITLALQATEPCGFDYRAHLHYALDGTRFIARMVITHCGATPMLYGAGFHPFFVKTPRTRLGFSASGYWPEDQQHLPLAWTSALPAALDFTVPSLPGAQWINNGYSGWNGIARLIMDDREVVVRSDTPWLMVYQTEESEFICLEPQTHPVDAHNMPGQPGLRMLAQGESMRLEMTVVVKQKSE